MMALCKHSFRKGKPVCVWVHQLSFWSVEVWITVLTSGTWRPRDCTAPLRWELSKDSGYRHVDVISETVTKTNVPPSLRTIKKRWPVCPLMPVTAPLPPVPPVEICSSTVWPPMCPAKPSVTAATRSDRLSPVFVREEHTVKYSVRSVADKSTVAVLNATACAWICYMSTMKERKRCICRYFTWIRTVLNCILVQLVWIDFLLVCHWRVAQVNGGQHKPHPKINL